MSITSADIESFRKGASGNVEFLIRVTVRKKQWTIAKTFNDFLKLNEFLQRNSGYLVKCNLSVPRRFSSILLDSDNLAKQRQSELQSYLNVLVEDKTILKNSLVREFLEVESNVKNYDKEKVPNRKTLSTATAEQLLMAIKSMIEGQSDALSTFLQQAQIFNPSSDTTRQGSSISTVGTAPIQNESSFGTEPIHIGLVDSLRQFIDKERNDMKAKLAAANEKIQDLTITLKVQEVLVASLQKKLSFATGALIAASQDSEIFKSPLKKEPNLPRAEAQHTPQATVSADVRSQYPTKSSTKKSCTAEELKLNIRLSKSKSKLRGMLEKHALREEEMRNMITNLQEAQRKMLGMVIQSYGTENGVCCSSAKGGKVSGANTNVSAGIGGAVVLEPSASKPVLKTSSSNHYENTDVDDNADGDASPGEADMRISVIESISNSLSIANRLSGMGKDFELEADTLMQTVSPPLGDHLPLDSNPIDADGNRNEFGDTLEIVNIADDAFLQLNAETLEYERICEDGNLVVPQGSMMDAVFQEANAIQANGPSPIGVIDSSPIAPSSANSRANNSALRRLFELTQFSPNSSVIFGLEDIYIEKSRYLAQTAPRFSQNTGSNSSAAIASPIPMNVSPAQQESEPHPFDENNSTASQQQLAMLTALKQQLDAAQARWSSFEDLCRDRFEKLFNEKSQTAESKELTDLPNPLHEEVIRLKAQNLDQDRTLTFLRQELEIARSKDRSEMESIFQLLKSNLPFGATTNTAVDAIASSHTQSSDGSGMTEEVSNLEETLSNLISQVAYIGETQREEFDARALDLMQRIDAQDKTINDLLLINKTQQSILMSTEEAMNYMKVENDVDRSGLRGQVYDANSTLREVKLLYQKAEDEKKTYLEEVDRLKKLNGDAQSTLSNLIATNQTQASALEFAQRELLTLREQRGSLMADNDNNEENAESMLLRSLYDRLVEWIPAQEAEAQELRHQVATSDNQSRSMDKLQQIQDTLGAVLQRFVEQQSSSLFSGDNVAKEVVKLTEALQCSSNKLSTIESHLTVAQESAGTVEILSDKKKIDELEEKVTSLTVRYNSAVELNKRYETEVFTLQRDVNHLKDSLNESQRYINDLSVQNKVFEEVVRAKKEELKSCLQRIKDGGDYNQELEQIKVSTEVEVDSLREEMQVYMQKIDQLKENNKVLDSTMKAMKSQFEREKGNLIATHKSELDALRARMETIMEQLRFQHDHEMSELQSRQKREIEFATKEKLNSVKSKVEHYVSELDADKQSLKDALVERDVEINRMQRQLELANIEIDRFKGKILSDSLALAASKKANSTHTLNELALASEPVASYSVPSKPRYSPDGTSAPHSTTPPEASQHKRKVTQQIAIEEVSISAKIKDPDQEALAAGILLSQQEAEFGTNMFESLREEDEDIIDEYIKHGFTREEAILMIFQDKFAKKTPHGRPQTSRRQEIMAMPHLLRQHSVRKIAYEMNQTISQRHSRNFSMHEIGKMHSRSPSLASVSQISLSRTSSNASLGSLRDPYPMQPVSRNTKFPEPFVTPRSQPTLTGTSAFSHSGQHASTISSAANTATSAVGAQDQFQGNQTSSHKRHHSQYEPQSSYLQQQGSSLIRTYSLKQMQGYSNTPMTSSMPSHVRSGSNSYSSQLSEEDMVNVAKIMRKTGFDRPQAIQVYLSQRTT